MRLETRVKGKLKASRYGLRPESRAAAIWSRLVASPQFAPICVYRVLLPTPNFAPAPNLAKHSNLVIYHRIIGLQQIIPVGASFAFIKPQQLKPPV